MTGLRGFMGLPVCIGRGLSAELWSDANHVPGCQWLSRSVCELILILSSSNLLYYYTVICQSKNDQGNGYRSIGLNLKQLYGQTEAFLYVTAQPDGEIYSDTVGPACPNVDIKIADNGEIGTRQILLTAIGDGALRFGDE